MNKDTIIKILLGIIALLVFAWVWRIISGKPTEGLFWPP